MGLFGGDSSASNTNSDYGASGGGGVNSPTQILEVQAGKKSSPVINVQDQGTLALATQELETAQQLDSSPLQTILKYALVGGVIFLVVKHFKWI
ncbi:MAG TPA: hypothetical protein VGG48_19085 [Rhizomicrobium sp.]|jgi:hypothetical protein